VIRDNFSEVDRRKRLPHRKNLRAPSGCCLLLM
jgi:hypothetical protein